ncbi:C2 domain-containing protein, partial [Baffinella frigidus]
VNAAANATKGGGVVPPSPQAPQAAPPAPAKLQPRAAAATAGAGAGGGGVPSLRITVHSAQNLPKVDTFGSIDPYVAVLFGSTDQRTRTVKNDMAPIFDETFDISLAGDAKEVVLVLYDWERVGKDRAIGEIRLPVRWLAEQGSLSRQSYGLRSLTDANGIAADVKNKAGVPSSLTISLTHTPAPKQPAHAAPVVAPASPPTAGEVAGAQRAASVADGAAQAALEAAQQDLQVAERELTDALQRLSTPGGSSSSGKIPPRVLQVRPGTPAPTQTDASAPWSLRVEVVSAAHLPKMDMTGKADPYVVVSLGEVTHRTQTVKNSLVPP